MEADLKLVGNKVQVEACDLVVDAAERRKQQGGYRRALVHDFNDGLTINWDNDYPGGVTVNGVRLIRKAPDWVAPIAIQGGVALTDGGLHVTGGGKAVFSDTNPADDFVSGEIFQDDDGLHVAGAPVAHETKPVVVHAPIARKTITFEMQRDMTAIAPRVREAGVPGRVRLAAGLGPELVRGSRPVLTGGMVVELDLVDTIMKLMNEITELRTRVEQLEGG